MSCCVNPEGAWLPEEHMLKLWYALALVNFSQGISLCSEINLHTMNASKVTRDKKILLGRWGWSPSWALLTAGCNSKQVDLFLFWGAIRGQANSSSETVLLSSLSQPRNTWRKNWEEAGICLPTQYFFAPQWQFSLQLHGLSYTETTVLLLSYKGRWRL